MAIKKLSDDLAFWRVERPDEGIMDRFARKAHALETINAELLEACKGLLRLCQKAGLNPVTLSGGPTSMDKAHSRHSKSGGQGMKRADTIINYVCWSILIIALSYFATGVIWHRMF